MRHAASTGLHAGRNHGLKLMSSDSRPSLFAQPSPWPAFWRGVRVASGLPSLILVATMLGIGGLCRDIGYPVGAGVLSTLLIWAGPAQVLVFGSIAAGAALPAIAIAVSLSSIRFVPMCMSILPLMRQDAEPASEGRPARAATPVWLLMLLSHYVAVTAWVEGVRRLPQMPREVRIPYFLGFANTVLIAATAATAAGYYIIGELPPALAAGLLFMSPVYFTLALAAGARRMIDWLALVLGFAAAPLTALFAPPGLDLVIGGVGMGSLAYAIHRIANRTKREAP